MARKEAPVPMVFDHLGMSRLAVWARTLVFTVDVLRLRYGNVSDLAYGYRPMVADLCAQDAGAR